MNVREIMRNMGLLALIGLMASLVQALNVNGGFNPTVNGGVNALAVQADGKILLGGSFNTLDLLTQSHLARFEKTALFQLRCGQHR